MSVPADLDQLKARLGIRTLDQDGRLTQCLDVASGWVDDRVYRDPDTGHATRHPEVVEAILILASRLHARRNSPEGVAGWNDLGVIRILASDPDVGALLERHIDYSNAGLA